MIKVAALFVLEDGPYSGDGAIDPWPESRDARLYAGPFPVVAHPPCKRWGRYWSGGPQHAGRFKLGDDGGCFESALKSVREWGGVIEHPEASHAWRCFGLRTPSRGGGWFKLICGGWTCCVEQGHYGHRARKATWLYVYGCDDLPSLPWGKAEGCIRMDDGYHSAAERRLGKAKRDAPTEQLSKRQRAVTPPAFRDLLVSIAQRCKGDLSPC